MDTTKTIYEDMRDAGVPIANHCSDLYVPVTPVTTKILNRRNANRQVFTNQVEGGRWYDIAGAFDPYWNARLDALKGIK